MRTTIDIPEDMMQEARRFADTKTKRETVLKGLEEIIKQGRRRELIERLGTFKIDMTREEIKRMRAMD